MELKVPAVAGTTDKNDILFRLNRRSKEWKFL